MNDELDSITHPRPMAEELEVWFRHWSDRHPFIADRQPSPKSVARDLLERGKSFADYVRDHDLVHHEHNLYHYLSDVHRILTRALDAAPLPESMQTTDESDAPSTAAARRVTIETLLDDLAALVETIDSSVAEEWARHGLAPDLGAIVAANAARAASAREARAESSRFAGLLRRMVRTQAFGWVRALAQRNYEALAGSGLTAEAMRAQLEPYWGAYGEILVTADARGPDLFDFDSTTGRVRQWILDPEGDRQWFIEGAVDLDASRAGGEPVMRVVQVVDQSTMLGIDPDARDNFVAPDEHRDP